MGDSSPPNFEAFASRKRATVPDRLDDLQGFADQLFAIAEQMRDGQRATGWLRNEQSRAGNDKGPAPTGQTTPADRHAKPLDRHDFAQMARQAYKVRRQRDRIFGKPELFGEPAWDILLDLYIAQAAGKAVSVSDACIGSASPSTTGLRWLGILAEDGFIIREHDPQDQRRVLVKLSDKGLTAMDDYFATTASQPID